jgi:hypothetical protein
MIWREEYQAATLAERFASRPEIRMVVHAGHGQLNIRSR